MIGSELDHIYTSMTPKLHLFIAHITGWRMKRLLVSLVQDSTRESERNQYHEETGSLLQLLPYQMSLSLLLVTLIEACRDFFHACQNDLSLPLYPQATFPFKTFNFHMVDGITIITMMTTATTRMGSQGNSIHWLTGSREVVTC